MLILHIKDRVKEETALKLPVETLSVKGGESVQSGLFVDILDKTIIHSGGLLK